MKILDMGLARVGLVDEADKDRLTQSGQVMGTCDYMAPEQAMDTHHADHRADIYSLGCTLYRLLTGEVLFQGDTLMKILWAHQQSPIPSLRKVRGDVSPQLDAVFQKMVAKRPEDRQRSMTDVIADLERCMGRLAGTAPSLGDVSDRAMQDALSFLREEAPAHHGTAAVKKKVEPAVEAATYSQQQAAAETSRQLDLPHKVVKAVREKKVVATAVGLGVLAVGIVFFSVLIRIRHPDGRQTLVRVPEGSRVAVSKSGDVDVEVKAEDVAPAFKGGFDPAQAGQYKGPGTGQAAGETPRSPFVDAAGNWKLPPGAPPLAVAPFDGKKANEHQAAWAKHLAMPIEETNSIGMKLTLIPPGEFEMGSTAEEIAAEIERAKKAKEPQGYLDRVSAEGPRHRVRITKPFYLGMYHVT